MPDAGSPRRTQPRATRDEAGAARRTPSFEDLLRLLVERTEEYAIYLLDADGRVASWNVGAERIKGYRADEIIGKPYATFFTPEDRTAGKPERLLRRAREEGRVEDEGWRQRKDGSRFWTDALITALTDDGGRLLGYAKVTRDLTERRYEISAELAEERERFTAIFEQATVGIVQRDLAGRFVLVNDRFCQIVGRSREELLGKRDIDLVHPEDRAANLELLERLLTTGEPYTLEKRYVRPDNEVVWVNNSVTLIHDADGKPRYVLAVTHDVTARRHAENALRLRAALIEAAHEAIFAWDTTNGITFWNRGAEELYGYTSEEALGRRSHDLLATPPDQVSVFIGALERESRWDGELSHRTKDGRRLIVDARVVLVESGTDGPKVLETTRDITAQRKAEEALREAIRVRDDFLAGASHDLKNPLGSMSGNAQLLLRTLQRTGTVPPDRLEKSLKNIAASIDDMVDQINDLLDVTRLRLGEALSLDLEPTDLVALAQRSLARQQAGTERHRLQLRTDAPELVGDWDRARLERALGNLLSNAIKYTPDGGEIRVDVRRDGSHAVLSVADQGIGIPEADAKRIFDRFGRGRNVVGRITGSGIGLAATKQIVEQHGGTIEVESREGEGATFTVRLPLEQAADNGEAG